MIRSVLACVLIAISTIFFGGGGFLLFMLDRSGRIFHVFAKSWVWTVLFFAGAKVRRISGLENIDRKRSYVFVANHQSLFDIPLLFHALPHSIVMTPKKELFRIPFMGWAIKAAGFIEIDRSRPELARERLRKAAQRLKGKRISVLMFPEGTRSATGEIKPFKKGAFHVAFDLDVAMVPVSVHGTRAIASKGSLRIRPGDVRVHVGEPVELQGDSPEERTRVMNELRTRVLAGVEELERDAHSRG